MVVEDDASKWINNFAPADGLLFFYTFYLILFLLPMLLLLLLP